MSVNRAIRVMVENHRRNGCTRADCLVMRRHTKPWRIYRTSTGSLYGNPKTPWHVAWEPTFEESEKYGKTEYLNSFSHFELAVLDMQLKQGELGMKAKVVL